MSEKIQKSNFDGQIPRDIAKGVEEKKDYQFKYSLFTFKSIEEFYPKVPEPTEAEILHENWNNVRNGLSEKFFENIEDMSKRLKCSPEDLSAVIYGESRFDPTIIGDGKYKGLAQMTGASLKNSIKYAETNDNGHPPLNKKMSIDHFVKLSREEQLPYVEAYLNMIKDDCGLKGKKLSGAQLWTFVLSPKNIDNKAFLKNVEAKLDSIKRIPKNYEIPQYIKRPKEK